MRFEGQLKSWNDERGFGFIEPKAGGQEIFVHVKAFTARAGRPQLGQRLSFEVELSRDGKKRASFVELVRSPVRSPKRTHDSPAQWGTASIFAIPLFASLYALVAVVWHVPIWFAAVYLGGSFLCLVAYAIDKSAAVAGGWRVPESTLLFLGLAGGWPGAIVAQQLLRHKSSKAAFRRAFWGTVIVNVLGFVAINTPLLSRLNP